MLFRLKVAARIVKNFDDVAEDVSPRQTSERDPVGAWSTRARRNTTSDREVRGSQCRRTTTVARGGGEWQPYAASTSASMWVGVTFSTAALAMS